MYFLEEKLHFFAKNPFFIMLFLDNVFSVQKLHIFAKKIALRYHLEYVLYA